MVAEHKPFRIVMKIGAPVILKGFAPSLDGLLFAVVEAHHGKGGDTMEKLKSLLKWNPEGFFHASMMRFVVNNKSTLTAARLSRSDCMKTKLNSELIAPNSQGDKYVRVVTEGGPYKTRLTQRNAYCAPFVVFDGVGDKDAIAALLDHYLCGVGYDAQNNGQGEIVDMSVFDMPDDLSIAIDGNANRSIPEKYAQKSGITGMTGHNRIAPPYFLADPVPVVMPEPVRIIHESEIANSI